MRSDPLVLDVLISIAYWKGLISGVNLSIVVPQAIGISLSNTCVFSVKLQTKRQRKFSFPCKLWSSTRLVGAGRAKIDATIKKFEEYGQYEY